MKYAGADVLVHQPPRISKPYSCFALATLQKHFSQAYEDLTSEVAGQVAALEGSLFQIALPDERDFMPDLKEQFLTLKGKLNAWVAWSNGAINELIALAKKKQIALETSFSCVVDTSRSVEVT